jgi:TonB family protein
MEEKISARFTDEAGEWFDVTPGLAKTVAGAPVINRRGELVGVVTVRRGSNSCAIRTAAAAATLLSQVSSNTTASWRNLTAASRPTTMASSATPARTQIPSKIPLKGSKLVYAPAPRYPPDARQSRGAGQASGSFRVLFDANGRAVSVQTIRSTGNSALDQAAVSALHEWRSEAGGDWSLIVPITFKP